MARKAARYILLGLGLVVLAVAITVSSVENYVTLFVWKPCAPEQLDRIFVPNSRWMVETWMAACGFGLHGPLQIYAINTVTMEKLTLAMIDDPSNARVSMDNAHNLVITLPTAVQLRDHRDRFGEVRVLYERAP